MTGLHTLIAELNDDRLTDELASMFANWATADLSEGCTARLKSLRLGELRPAELEHSGASIGACMFLGVLSEAEQDAAILSMERAEAADPTYIKECRRLAQRAGASFGLGALPSGDRLVYSDGAALGCCASEVGEPISSRPGEYELVHKTSAGTRSTFLTFRGGDDCPEGITEECLLEVLADRLRQRFGDSNAGMLDVENLRRLLADNPWSSVDKYPDCCRRVQCPNCICDHAQPPAADEVT